MKSSKKTRLLLSVVVAAALSSGPAFAQMPAAPSAGVNAAMTRLFGNNTAFTAKAELHVLDKTQKETTSLPMGFAMAEGKIRMDMDMTRIQSSELPSAAVSAMKEMKIDQVVTIIRPDRKVTIALYPLIQAYVENPLGKEETADLGIDFKLNKTKLGTETVDGHPCDKNKVVVLDGQSTNLVATVWNATDLKDFPVQIELPSADDTVIFKFKDVKLSRPEARLFEPPPGYKKYDSGEALTKKVTGQN